MERMRTTRAQKRRRKEEAEAKKVKSLAGMPPLVLAKVAEHLEHYDRLAFALTCTSFRDAIEEVVKNESDEWKERERSPAISTFYRHDEFEPEVVKVGQLSPSFSAWIASH